MPRATDQSSDVKISCGILAGGESRRMGRNKALVDFDGRPLVVRIVDRLSLWSDDVFVVEKTSTDLGTLGIRVYRDDLDARTPLAGIVTALRAATHPHVFVCATDMPHVSRDLVELLASRASGADAVVPEHDGRIEPLHAVWSAAAAGRVAVQMGAGERAVHRVLERLNVITVAEDEWRTADPHAMSFTNVNTPDELEAARP